MKDEDWVDCLQDKIKKIHLLRCRQLLKFAKWEEMEEEGKEYNPRMRYAELEHFQNLADNPPHYTKSKIQPLDVIMDWELDFPLGNIVKLVRRLYEKDTPLQNLYKIRKYLSVLIEKEEKKFSESDPH